MEPRREPFEIDHAELHDRATAMATVPIAVIPGIAPQHAKTKFEVQGRCS